jgi:hypothetical protein
MSINFRKIPLKVVLNYRAMWEDGTTMTSKQLIGRKLWRWCIRSGSLGTLNPLEETFWLRWKSAVLIAYNLIW